MTILHLYADDRSGSYEEPFFGLVEELHCIVGIHKCDAHRKRVQKSFKLFFREAA